VGNRKGITATTASAQEEDKPPGFAGKVVAKAKVGKRWHRPWWA